jgi:hypothetical protein
MVGDDMIEIPPAQIDAFRSAILQGPDSKLITDVGYFIIWFSAAELGITTLLAVASNSGELGVFDTLCSGMDARVKVERLRRIRKSRGGIGPNLDARLRYFDEKARKIRNLVAHSYMGVTENMPGRYFAASLGSLPWKELNTPAPMGIQAPPRILTPAELLGWGGWLARFCEDLSACFNQAATGGAFEIENAKSQVP